MGIVTDKLVYGALSWTALDKNANDRGIKDTHTSDDVGILWAADTIATQQARIERLETDNAKFIQANIEVAKINAELQAHIEELETLLEMRTDKLLAEVEKAHAKNDVLKAELAEWKELAKKAIGTGGKEGE